MKTKIRIPVLTFIVFSFIAPPAFAENNTTPKQGSGVSCSCMCKGASGIDLGMKVWSWSGNRADCKAMAGSACLTNNPDGGLRSGELSGCDTIVTGPRPPKPGADIKPAAPADQSNPATPPKSNGPQPTTAPKSNSTQ